MKNFETILSEAGITMTDEQKKAVTAAMMENYKPIADWQVQNENVKSLTEQLRVAKESLDKFEGVNLEEKDGEIATLKKKLEDMEKEHQSQIADRDFHDVLKEAISAAKGRNEKAIMALLDMDTLRKSKNQKEDVTAALKVLAEAEDSSMLFGEPDAKPVGSGDTIGSVKNGGTEDTSTLKDALKDYYK